MATMTSQKREARDWALFADWCTSTDAPPLPTTAEVIADFLAAFPAPIEAQGRRVKAIRKAHESAGQELVLPTAPRATVLRAGSEWASVPRALDQVPKYHHPKGFSAAVRGRRDGWLIVLVGVLSLSRNEARDLEPADVRLLPGFPWITIKGIPIPKTDQAPQCPACAVTRWLRIAGAASFGFWNEVQATVSPTGVDPDAHDCANGLDGVWRQASTLLPSVDRHGAVSFDAMSVRAISTTMRQRQALGPVAEIKARVALSGGRFDDATMDELADAYDDVDRRAAKALLRLKAIVDDSDEMLKHLKEFRQ